jgi:hypothetical protein
MNDFVFMNILTYLKAIGLPSSICTVHALLFMNIRNLDKVVPPRLAASQLGRLKDTASRPDFCFTTSNESPFS